MTSSSNIRCADALIQILEGYNVKYIFGHPGEQVLPLYDALRNSEIKHVLMRHEQGAAHAADGYARASGYFGVCVASAGPGALNLTMGVAAAYKDSVPLLIITGDVPLPHQGKNVFQEIFTCQVFKPITLHTFNITSPREGVLKLRKAIKMLQKGRTGPIHLNFPQDVLMAQVSPHTIHNEIVFYPETDYGEVDKAINLIEDSKKPLILAGAGILWAHAEDQLIKFAEKHRIPVATTYPARGVIPEDHPLSLGMMGIRGTDAANFAGGNCDVVIVLGSRLSERTLSALGKGKMIQVNLDKTVLRGDVNILGDVKDFIHLLQRLKTGDTENWLSKLMEYPNFYEIKTDYEELPLKPQRAIKEILDASNDSIVVNDAGTHTTWVTLLKKVKEPSSLIFSGGLGPMGYGLPAAVGAALAQPEKTVIVVVGDGGFQMTLQELATISQLHLPILICLIDNSSLGIIRQWQDLYYSGRYEVELLNPDFIKLAESYNIKAARVKTPGQIYNMVRKTLKGKTPYLLDVIVDKNEGIPLPKVM